MKEYLKVKAKKGESLLSDTPLFVSINSARISPRQVRRDFKEWVKKSGIESNLSPHALRNTVGTRLLKEFKNAKLVQRYLGHSDVATTLTPLEVSHQRRLPRLWRGLLTGLRYYVDVFPEDLPPHQLRLKEGYLTIGGGEEAAEMLRGKVITKGVKMSKIIALLTIMVLVSGCATLYEPYSNSAVSDPYKEINEYNDSFFKVYHSDLRVWVGKPVDELDQAFSLKGSRSLDVYGNGTIIYEVINPGAAYGLPGVNARLIFYVKNNKIYNVVKE